MKSEIENEEIANAGAAIRKCDCEYCLLWRDRLETPISYVGWKRRCRVCGALDSISYPKFLATLEASKDVEDCELYRGLCNRSACKRNRRFQGEIPDIQRTHDKGSYPSDYSKTNWLLDPSEISIHPDLVNWAQNPLPSDRKNVVIRGVSIPAAFGILGWGRNTRYGSKIEFKPKDSPEPATALQWEDESAEWRDLKIISDGNSQLDFGDPPTGERKTYRLETYKTHTGQWKTRRVENITFDVVGTGTRKSEAREFAEASHLYAYQRRSYYKSDPKTLLEHGDLMRTANLEPDSRVKRTGEWLWVIAGGLTPTTEEIIAKQYEEKHRQKHPDKEDNDYLPRAVAYGETIGGVKESDESLTDFYVRWADKLNPAGWNWQEATAEQKATILGNPDFKRALYQMLIATGVARVNELEPEKNSNTVAQWVRREFQNPLDSITEKDLLDSGGRIGIAVILNNRAKVKVIVPQDAPMSQVLDALNREKAKSARTAAKNATQEAKRERLGKRATKEAVDEAMRRVEQAYNDADSTVKFLYVNGNTANELAAK